MMPILGQIGSFRTRKRFSDLRAFYVLKSENSAIYFRNRNSLAVPLCSNYMLEIQMQFLRSLVGGMRPKTPRLREVGFWAGMSEGAVGLVEIFAHPTRPNPADLVDRFWPSQERVRVITHLKRGREHASYFGTSTCRLCGLADLGCKDLTDGVWIWPEGFAHYLEMHAVKPPQEFVDHALRQVR
jgi:hypothetical protein